MVQLNGLQVASGEDEHYFNKISNDELNQTRDRTKPSVHEIQQRKFRFIPHCQ